MVSTHSIICFKSTKLVYPWRIFWDCVTYKFYFLDASLNHMKNKFPFSSALWFQYIWELVCFFFSFLDKASWRGDQRKYHERIHTKFIYPFHCFWGWKVLFVLPPGDFQAAETIMWCLYRGETALWHADEWAWMSNSD